MKKKIFAILLCMTVALSLAACGDTKEAKDTPVITDFPAYDNLNDVLSGEYEVTEEIIGAYFTEIASGAGVGVVQVTDRDTVQEGDIVKVDYTGYKDGVAFSGGAATDQWIDVSNNCGFDIYSGNSVGGFITGFTDGLLGAKIGEKVEGNVTFPAEYHAADLAGQPAVFEFLVHEIYIPVTLENITDAFVEENLSGNYGVSTVADLRNLLEEELAYSFTMNYLIQNSSIEIPESYLNSRLEDYKAYFKELYCANVSLEEYLGQYGYTVEQMEVEWKASLEGQIKAELVFAKVVEEQNLKTDNKAHKEYIEKITTANSDSFPTAESIYKYAGAGDMKKGEEYLKIQTAVREYITEQYRNAIAE